MNDREKGIKCIYKFLKENKIEDISNLIKYKLGEIDYNNPDGIEIEIKPDNITSLIYVILKYGDYRISLCHNPALYSFLMDNAPIEEVGKLLLLTYIRENNISSPQKLINSIYNECYVPAYKSNWLRNGSYLFLEFGEGLKITKAYFKEKHLEEKAKCIEVNIEDFYEIPSSLGK